jgi:hypothetical protein
MLQWDAAPDFPHMFAIHSIGYRTSQEWPKLRARLDAGVPTILVLIRVGPDSTANPTHNHQVLATGYSYDASTGDLRLTVYDPNDWTSQHYLSFDLKTDSGALKARDSSGAKLRGFFVNPDSDAASGITPGRRPGPGTSIPLDVMVHLENIGDRLFHGAEFAGTRGDARRLEGFSIKINPPVPGLSIRYRAHVQDIGDIPWVSEGEYVGTRGQSRRLEGLQIELTGPNAGLYSVAYMAHLQDIGDTFYFSDGVFCGTRGQSRRVEGMSVCITRS